MSDSPEEQAHWRSVIKAFDGYMQYHLSANHARRMAFLALLKESRTVLETVGYRQKLEDVDEGIRRNAEFLEEMIADPLFAEMIAEGDGHGHDHHNGEGSHDHSHRQGHSRSHVSDHADHSHSATAAGLSTALPKPSDRARHSVQDKVRSTLRSFVRDWSEEGAGEREACYAPCLEALERHFPDRRDGRSDGNEDTAEAGNGSSTRKRERGEIKVLVPGCGLGRLTMEVAAKGFAAQGNEFSTYMLLASHWVLNQTTHAKSHTIYPYLHSFSNHLSTSNLLRSVKIPDICPADVLGQGQGGAFSLVAGDFEDIYGGDESEGMEEKQKGQWGAVVTCFFIDCARNILRFLRIIHDLLEDDGIWINIGPLLWHFENSPTSSSNGEGSIELSLDEVKTLARSVGFEIHEERMVRTTYTGMPDTMLRHEYNAAFWTATKRRPS